jgi:hypothetical protein
MKLDYIDNINEYGDNIVRLYEFDSSQADKFQQMIKQVIIKDKSTLDLATVDFIEARNCNLVLRISDEELGITTSDNKIFFCDTTIKGYEQMVLLLEPFCKKQTKGFQWLYDIDSSTDFLFSPAGTW